MNNLILFTDGSVDTKTHIGFGAYLAIENLETPGFDLIANVKTKQFENTSSTLLEMQTLVWAIDDGIPSPEDKTIKLTIYTDSQNILGLLTRRKKLEQKKYYTSNGKRLKNADIYGHFYNIMDRYDCHIIKVDGHKPRHEKNDIDKIFTLVDKASRLALRHFRYETSSASK
ncbi:MAG: ribonuclease H [Gammaproteobacteria bacterium]|nr:MAG: ribonuclease H [Gammaproteobacteria bacterium]